MAEYIYLRLGDKDFLQEYEKYEHLDDYYFDWVSPQGSETCHHGRILEFRHFGGWVSLNPIEAKKLCDENPKKHITLPVTQNLTAYATVQIRNVRLRVEVECK